ncbi:MAG: transporter substrate-binding domain-containing protein [Alphaproteobacteria bacterium]|nr:transporter substrate-binding domain-containing protein [Alphaproteobacteria bacterium]
MPRFRHPGAALTVPEVAGSSPIRLLADADFPPFSFASQSGGPAGLAVELALASCAEARLRCEVTLMPGDTLLKALAAGEADAVISGPRIDEATLNVAAMTRPYFRTMGRFTVLSGNPLAGGDAASLYGKRIGVVKDTVHARWLETFYGNSDIVTFPGEADARTALRTGNVDAVFGDNLRTIYWVAGADSQGCCRLLGGAYSDFDHFSRNFAFLVRADRDDLRAALDYGLDMTEAKGLTSKIFNAYVPLSPW